MHLISKNTHKLKVKSLKKIYQACGNWKEVRVAILISDKADFMQAEETSKVTTC
jgi:hypothetical protein